MNSLTPETREHAVILLIDDNESSIGMLVKYLQEVGLDVITARNGRMGLKRAQFAHPDLILLDVMMPEMDGFEVCRQLKADSKASDIPVIFMTALHEVQNKVKGFSAGGVDYITKPIQQEEVLARVRTHLKIQAQQRQLQEQAIALAQARELEESARKAAERANAAKSRFLANMSHELRTPLNTILGFSQLALQDQTQPPVQQEHLEIIHRSGEHLLTLINDVLDMAKIEAGRTTVNEEGFELQSMLHDLHSMLRLKANQKGLFLKLDCQPAVPKYVVSDAIKLRQVLINLIGNAIKFTETGGVIIHIASEALNSSLLTLQCSISDTGPGIAPDEMSHLFEPFAQTSTGRHTQNSSGLGLSISKHFVELLGGELSVSSDMGKGSVFSFYIHVKAAQHPIRDDKSCSRHVIALESGQPHYRILIADDAGEHRRLLKELLKPLGFDLQEARDGLETLKLWHTWQPHIILMNMRMPRLDGYETTTRIRSEESQWLERQSVSSKQHLSGRPIPIIAITASSLEEEHERILAVGCDDHLRKPFQAPALFELLHRHLGIRYVYASNSPEPQKADRHSGASEELTAETLARLPQEFLENLRDSARTTDIFAMEKLIERIRDTEPVIAAGLEELAKEFNYTKILELI